MLGNALFESLDVLFLCFEHFVAASHDHAAEIGLFGAAFALAHLGTETVFEVGVDDDLAFRFAEFSGFADCCVGRR